MFGGWANGRAFARERSRRDSKGCSIVFRNRCRWCLLQINARHIYLAFVGEEMFIDIAYPVVDRFTTSSEVKRHPTLDLMSLCHLLVTAILTATQLGSRRQQH
jgi:prepilin signal peptidase PulO-like enzyme (type II secretory pathway)